MCNCGKYIAQLGRLALIADQPGQVDLRRQLVAFMRQELNLWFDAADPTDPLIGDKTRSGIFDHFTDDRTNGAIVAASPSDSYFPAMRMYGRFRGQHVADAGPTDCGGSPESSSESINFDYTLALWGDVNGNALPKALASVLTAQEIRSAQAFYQVTPDTSVFRDEREQAGVVPVSLSLSVTTAAGKQQRTLDPNSTITRGIVWSHISEDNHFFDARQAYLTGMHVLPVTPISEYVLGNAWEAARATDIRAVEDQLTVNCTAAIAEVPVQFVGAMPPALPTDETIELLGVWSTAMQSVIADYSVLICRFGGERRRWIGLGSAARWP